MRTFAHFNPKTIDEAVAVLQRYGTGASVIAGGTDILGKMKDEILPKYPEALVNIKSVEGLDFIEEGQERPSYWCPDEARRHRKKPDSERTVSGTRPGGGQDRLTPPEGHGYHRWQYLSGYPLLVLQKRQQPLPLPQKGWWAGATP